MILTEVEQNTLICHINKTNNPGQFPKLSARERIRAIAKMGGHNGRKGEGHPGMITLWRGWIKLQDKVEMYEVMK